MVFRDPLFLLERHLARRNAIIASIQFLLESLSDAHRDIFVRVWRRNLDDRR